jgi:hypothetical protein
MDSNNNNPSDCGENDNNNQNPTPERQGTPERPPYSPVTPVLAHLAAIPGGATIVPPPAIEDTAATTMAVTKDNNDNVTSNPPKYNEPINPQAAMPPPQHPPQAQQQPQQQPSYPPPNPIRPEPSPVPISESDNTDVIALRSALSLLQFQKQKALNDIKALDELKRAAAADPEGFSKELLAGNLTQHDNQFINTDITMQDDDDENDNSDEEAEEPKSKFGKIPKPQNVVRMPPINWAKYHIVGEPLDKMHEEQRNRPFAGVPRQDPNQRAPEHFVAAPYRPLTDRIESPVKGGRGKRERKT